MTQSPLSPPPGLALREIERADIARINAWRNDPEVISGLFAGFRYITEEVDQAWFDAYLRSRDSNIRLAILNGGRHIGNVQLTGIHPVNRSAEFSIFIGDKDQRGQGAGNWATRRMILHGFTELNLNRIFLTVLEDNRPAIRVYEKAGFRTEGLQRQAVFKDGRYQNAIMMSLLAAEIDPAALNA